MDTLKARIAAALGWTEADVNSFSLPALRDLVRGGGKHPKLVYLCDEAIRTGSHILGEPMPRSAKGGR